MAVGMTLSTYCSYSTCNTYPLPEEHPAAASAAAPHAAAAAATDSDALALPPLLLVALFRASIAGSAEART